MFVCVIDGSKGLSFDVMELGRKKKQTPGRESVLYNVVLWRGDQVGRGDSSSSSRVRSFGPVTRSTCWVTGCPLAPEKHGLSGPWRRPWLSKPASCTITSAHRLSFTSRHAVSTRKKKITTPPRPLQPKCCDPHKSIPPSTCPHSTWPTNPP